MAAVLVAAGALACVSPLSGDLGDEPARSRGKRAQAGQPKSADDLLIVDCLRPSKVRRLGRRSRYSVPRQPIKVTAVECRIRGGEYTQPDQATLATALGVWQLKAKLGDAEAQFYVGQIFEKGLGVAPDYSAAAQWYLRAAEQGYTAAQFNLGQLYEQGLGVDPDGVAALNWYRKASGLPDEMIVLEESSYAELLEARAERDRGAEQIEALEREVEELRRLIDELEAEAGAGSQERAMLRSTVSRLEAELARQRAEAARHREKVDSLEQRLASRSPAAGPPGGTIASIPGEIDFGRYHALVIGNKDYQALPPVESAIEDARNIAAVLESKYGFETRILLNATRYDLMTALNELRESLTTEDNLLVFYAGHGRRDESGEGAYWQPVDAEPVNRGNWIRSEMVSEHLDLVQAKHVLVVADTVFSGLRTRSSVARLPRGMTDEERFHNIRRLVEKRARLVLTSGGQQPVRDAESTGPSRFSRALLEVLEDNDQVVEAYKVYEQLSDRLTSEGGPAEKAIPEFAAMRWARNDIADFIFVPAS